MDTMKNDIREELKEVVTDSSFFTERFEDEYTYEEFETDFDEYIQHRYNTHPMTKDECIAIVGNDLQLYLEMDQVAREYWCELTGEVYNKSGLVNIVPLWLLSVAEEWKNDELESLYNELTRDPLAIQQ
jgi:hypothetical protein